MVTELQNVDTHIIKKSTLPCQSKYLLCINYVKILAIFRNKTITDFPLQMHNKDKHGE